MREQIYINVFLRTSIFNIFFSVLLLVHETWKCALEILLLLFIFINLWFITFVHVLRFSCTSILFADNVLVIYTHVSFENILFCTAWKIMITINVRPTVLLVIIISLKIVFKTTRLIFRMPENGDWKRICINYCRWEFINLYVPSFTINRYYSHLLSDYTFLPNAITYYIIVYKQRK